MIHLSHIDFTAQCALIEARKGIKLDRMSGQEQYEVEKVALSLAKTNLELLFFCPPGRDLHDFVTAVLSGRETNTKYDDGDFVYPDRFSRTVYSTRDYWWVLYLLMKHHNMSNKIPIPDVARIQGYIRQHIIP